MLVSVLSVTTCDVREQDVGETTGHSRDINLNWLILLSAQEPILTHYVSVRRDG